MNAPFPSQTRRLGVLPGAASSLVQPICRLSRRETLDLRVSTLQHVVRVTTGWEIERGRSALFVGLPERFACAGHRDWNLPPEVRGQVFYGIHR
jgi:hypothetical protein